MASQTLLFDTGTPSLESHIPEQITHQRQQSLERDLKELERINSLISIVKPTADTGEMHSRLTELRKHGCQIMPHSEMNNKELTNYYRSVRSELRTQILDAECNLSLHQYPEHLIYN